MSALRRLEPYPSNVMSCTPSTRAWVRDKVFGSRCLLVLLLAIVGCSPYRPADTEAFKVQGNAIIVQLQAYHSVHGEYPRSLKDLNEVDASTPFGPWRYSVMDKGQAFELLLGDYDDDGFNMYFESRTGEWFTDS